MGTEADAANNKTGADEGVNPDDLYDDKGGEQDDKSTDDKAKGESEEDAGGGGSDDELSEEEKAEAAAKLEQDEKDAAEKAEKDGSDDEDVVPEKYELTIAKDSLLDQTDIDRISTDAKEKGLTNGEAQLMADMEAEAIDRYHDKIDKQVEDMQAGWLKDAEADKEIGGEAFKENAELSKRLVDKYGSEALKDLLDQSKYGDHPEVVRIFSTIARQFMAEDKAFFPKAHEKGEKSMEETFYPSQK